MHVHNGVQLSLRVVYEIMYCTHRRRLRISNVQQTHGPIQCSYACTPTLQPVMSSKQSTRFENKTLIVIPSCLHTNFHTLAKYLDYVVKRYSSCNGSPNVWTPWPTISFVAPPMYACTHLFSSQRSMDVARRPCTQFSYPDHTAATC
jgi:hypothetical protein